MTPSEFARELREAVEAHPAVIHPFLGRFAAGELTRWQSWGYARTPHGEVSWTATS